MSKNKLVAQSVRIATGILVTLFVYGCATDSSHWEQTARSNSIAAYEAFLTQRPNSQYVGEAKHRLEVLYAERDWTAACRADDIRSYENFVKHRPSSQYVAEAKHRLEVLYAERDWATARQADDIKAYEEFMKQRPNSQYVGQAQPRIRMLERYRDGWEKVQQHAALQSYKDYCAQNPESPYLSKAWTAIADMEGREEVKPSEFTFALFGNGRYFEVDAKGCVVKADIDLEKFRLDGTLIELDGAKIIWTGCDLFVPTKKYGRVKVLFNSDMSLRVWLSPSQIEAFTKLRETR